VGDTVATVEDESAAGGKQQPLCRPVCKKARPAGQDNEEMEEDKIDSEEEDEDEDKAAVPARPGQPQKLSRYIIVCPSLLIVWSGQPKIFLACFINLFLNNTTASESPGIQIIYCSLFGQPRT
jgi:hypothetical protein